MTTTQLEQTDLIKQKEAIEPPPLNPGDHLSRVDFERRYEAHPDIKKAELIEGIVYMTSAVRFEQHGRPHTRILRIRLSHNIFD